MADLQPRHFENRDVNFETMFLPTQWGIKKKKKTQCQSSIFFYFKCFCVPSKLWNYMAGVFRKKIELLFSGNSGFKRFLVRWLNRPQP